MSKIWDGFKWYWIIDQNVVENKVESRFVTAKKLHIKLNANNCDTVVSTEIKKQFPMMSLESNSRKLFEIN